MDIIAPDTSLPAPYLRRLSPLPERVFYVARPGLRALPSGAGAVAAFGTLQAFTLLVLVWAIWWPGPSSRGDYIFDLSATAVLALLVIGVFVALARRFPGFVLAVMRAPFISLSVTDRRVLWTLPWMRQPLMEIGRERVLGGIVGLLDARGNGPAAIVLVPGDPCADIDGNIHFDRLPNAEAFVAALLER
jgi:hypothetical protein